ncbi:hypothetical protein PT974_09638 [Cladobotryum mycophilum]|uniref:Uncharacterized protein n=1 Tax=Cladobotryum mycophilum TaxID=491253 RepID=A0ABR0SGP8_9HYPO
MPMIRAMPRGFNCSLPRGWPLTDREDTGVYEPPEWEKREKWRGFNIVTRALAEEQHRVTELDLDVRQLYTGLKVRLFDNVKHQDRLEEPVPKLGRATEWAAEACARLRNTWNTIARFTVQTDDLIAFLVALLLTLRYIELSFLTLTLLKRCATNWTGAINPKMSDRESS